MKTLNLSDVHIRQAFIARERRRELLRLLFWLVSVFAGVVGGDLFIRF